MTHMLYVVGTPIGNLEDMTPRALDVLNQVGLIAAENPSKTQRLLSRYDIHTPMMRFTDAYDRKKRARLQSILDALQRTDVALVSEAGMPLLADPGYELMQVVLEKGIKVVPVPGPTALMTALAVSGLPTAPFVFLGFPPRKPKARRDLFGEHIQDRRTLVVYESPYRLVDTLRDAYEVLGERQVAVCCELTKLYEEVWRGCLSNAISLLEAGAPRGEFVVVVGGTSGGAAD
ncbi:MAG: 16S rRNA (cytidine(1402)-2'-O)-methyltransferase [Anaerolineae bacterium]|nr:16S rRNA (cytidine(1402)-2'-O)-methyltransferase [Anaerolineae bacterium]